MKVFSLALLGACGLVGTAFPAHADDVSLDVRLGFRDGRPVPAPRTPAPRFTGSVAPYGGPGFGTLPTGPVGPAAFADPRFSARGGHDDDDAHGRGHGRGGDHGHGRGLGHGFGLRHDDHATCEVVYIPAHEVPHHETVHVPAVYEDRRVPVFEMMNVPVKDWVIDPRTGRPHRIVVGMRTKRVQVGERIERVLVTPATTRVVTHYDLVPGRYVTICDGGTGGAHGGRHGRGHGGEHGRGHAGHAGEVMTSEGYRLAMAQVGQGPRGRGHDGDAWFTGERR